jgi:hypothetical protein
VVDAAMTYDEIGTVLARALVMRSPRFESETMARGKIEAIEDCMLESAYMHGELEEAYHYLTFSVAHLKRQVEEMTGYEAALPSKPAGRHTQADHIAAKRIADPAVFEAGAEARQLMDSIKRQLDRFEWEQATLSRVYTLISGG